MLFVALCPSTRLNCEAGYAAPAVAADNLAWRLADCRNNCSPFAILETDSDRGEGRYLGPESTGYEKGIKRPSIANTIIFNRLNLSSTLIISC